MYLVSSYVYTNIFSKISYISNKILNKFYIFVAFFIYRNTL